MYTAEVVMHKVQRNGVLEIIEFLGERVCQASKAPHAHTDR
jgi:hypothetical protein